jgi:Amt family ammonium transporter
LGPLSSSLTLVTDVASVKFVENKLKVDDRWCGPPLRCTAQRASGFVALGIFADGSSGGVSGLIVGDAGQIVAQLISRVVVTVWALGTGFLVFGFIKKTMGLRASAQEEEGGLDISEHGLVAYGE